MEGVYLYFVAIGSGLATGISLIVIPILWVYNRKSQKQKKSETY